MKKENKENKEKICGICKLGIDDTKEYAEFIQRKNSKEIQSTGYYHIKCYQEKIFGNMALLKQSALATDTMIKVREMMGIK